MVDNIHIKGLMSYIKRSNAGGVTTSVTKGIVSRVEVGNYSHSSTELLKIQIDATVSMEIVVVRSLWETKLLV